MNFICILTKYPQVVIDFKWYFLVSSYPPTPILRAYWNKKYKYIITLLNLAEEGAATTGGSPTDTSSGSTY
jgi:hypothetical protein